MITPRKHHFLTMTPLFQSIHLIFQKKMNYFSHFFKEKINIAWFQLLKCEYSELVFVVYDGKLNLFRF